MNSVLGVTIVGVAGLTLISAFFSSSEIAIFSLDRHRVATLSSTPEHRALGRLREDPHRLLVTILVSNNFVNVTIATLITGLALEYASQGIAITAATVIAGTIVLVFGEIVPKSIGVSNPERIATTVDRPIELIQTVISPVVWVFERITTSITSLTGGGMDIERPYVTREEIIALVRTAEAIGEIEDDEQAIIQRVFRFASTPINHAMSPIDQRMSLAPTATVGDVLESCAKHDLIRLPVLHPATRQLNGYVDLRDVLTQPRDTPIDRFIMPVLHVYAHRESDEVFAELRESGLEMAAVHDETEATTGYVPIEALVEEIIGEIYSIDPQTPITRLSPTTITASGTASIREINDILGSALPLDHETIRALISDELNRTPNPGDRITVGNTRVTIRVMRDSEIQRVHVERLNATESNRY